jgi:hypothetical protein
MKSVFIHQAHLLHVSTLYGHQEAFKNIKNVVSIRHWTGLYSASIVTSLVLYSLFLKL